MWLTIRYCHYVHDLTAKLGPDDIGVRVNTKVLKTQIGLDSSRRSRIFARRHDRSRLTDYYFFCERWTRKTNERVRASGSFLRDLGDSLAGLDLNSFRNADDDGRFIKPR